MLKLGHIEMLLDLLIDHPDERAEEIVEELECQKKIIESDAKEKFMAFMKAAGRYETAAILFEYDYDMDKVDCVCTLENKSNIHIVAESAQEVSEYFEEHEIEVRFCDYCGAPMQDGFTDESGFTHFCCYTEFAIDMDSRYGEDNWRPEPTGEKEWCYEYREQHSNVWESEPSFYTEWY